MYTYIEHLPICVGVCMCSIIIRLSLNKIGIFVYDLLIHVLHALTISQD